MIKVPDASRHNLHDQTAAVPAGGTQTAQAQSEWVSILQNAQAALKQPGPALGTKSATPEQHEKPSQGEATAPTQSVSPKKPLSETSVTERSGGANASKEKSKAASVSATLSAPSGIVVTAQSFAGQMSDSSNLDNATDDVIANTPGKIPSKHQPYSQLVAAAVPAPHRSAVKNTPETAFPGQSLNHPLHGGIGGDEPNSTPTQTVFLPLGSLGGTDHVKATEQPAPQTLNNPIPINDAAAASARLASVITTLHKNGGGTAVLQLTPPELGNLTIHIAANQSAVVNVTFIVAVPQTGQILHQNLTDLRQAMVQNGVTLGGTQISYGGQSNGHQQAPNQSKSNPPQILSAANAQLATGIRALA